MRVVKSNRPSGKNQKFLKGAVCPRCGQENGFIVEAATKVYLSDNGALTKVNGIDKVGSISYDDDSWATCPKCKYSDRLGGFKP